MNLLEKFRYCPVCGSSHFETASSKSKRCTGCGFEYFMNPAAAVVAFITNCKGELLVERRKMEPAKGTLDLPGGFADVLETGEEAVAREVMEETGLKVSDARYLFSQPNIYRYSGLDVHTLDMFSSAGLTTTPRLKPATMPPSAFGWLRQRFIPSFSVCVQSVRGFICISVQSKIKGPQRSLFLYSVISL